MAAQTGLAEPEPRVRARVPRPADSANRAYAAIRRLVIDFQLPPDERINEFRLARALALSRTPVREALNRLCSEGFLVFAPNRGFIFRAPHLAELLQVQDLRAILERAAFALSCACAPASRIAQLMADWSAPPPRMLAAEEMLDTDARFHAALAGLCGNQEIVRQLAAINARQHFLYRIRLGDPDRARAAGHDQILQALAARDAAAGDRLLAEHLALSAEDARQALAVALFGHPRPEREAAD